MVCDEGFIADSLRQLANHIESKDGLPSQFETSHACAEITPPDPSAEKEYIVAEEYLHGETGDVDDSTILFSTYDENEAREYAENHVINDHRMTQVAIWEMEDESCTDSWTVKDNFSSKPGRRLSLKKEQQTRQPGIASLLRMNTRSTLLTRAAQLVSEIEWAFFVQDGTEFRLPDMDRHITLDTDCVSASDFQYPVTVTDQSGESEHETRTAGKIVLDCGGNIFLYPRENGCEEEETEASDLSTDDLFRFVAYLENAFNVITKGTFHEKETI